MIEGKNECTGCELIRIFKTQGTVWKFHDACSFSVLSLVDCGWFGSGAASEILSVFSSPFRIPVSPCAQYL